MYSGHKKGIGVIPLQHQRRQEELWKRTDGEKTPKPKQTENMGLDSVGRGEVELQDLREDSAGFKDWEFRLFCWGQGWK